MRMSKDILKLVPNQSEAVKSLAEQYRKFAKASSENILGLAETVYIANRELNLRYLEEFYQEVGLDPKGTTARKLKEIGREVDALPALPREASQHLDHDLRARKDGRP